MGLKQRIRALSALGDDMQQLTGAGWQEVLIRASQQNPWFIPRYIRTALKSHAQYLSEDCLTQWTAAYELPEAFTGRDIGIIMAGNLPLVGFHDLLCTLLAGHNAQVKSSSKDKVLLPFLADKLITLEPAFKNRIRFVDKLQQFDAVLATGSNNTNRYFQYYFGRYPHLFRDNKSAVAILTGEESPDTLQALGKDVFLYFGLGCRNVSKLFVPEAYDFEPLLRAWTPYAYVMDNPKYKHNYDYHRTMLIMNDTPHHHTPFVMLKADEQVHSRIATVHYETYRNKKELDGQLSGQLDHIQCIVSESCNGQAQVVPPGYAQFPAPDDYPDGKDTLAFLRKI